MSDPRLVAFQQEAERVLQFLHGEFAKLQTGRANASLVEHVSVEAYGQRQALKAVAGISIQDAKTIVVQPWDRSIMSNIERALQAADLGTSPVNDGTVIRIVLPAMNQERRLQLTKVVHQLSEEARISIRQRRQEAHDKMKAEEDEDKRYTLIDELQKAVDSANEKIDESKKKKEEEVMTV